MSTPRPARIDCIAPKLCECTTGIQITTAKTLAEARKFQNYYVHVQENNSTYYIDCDHDPILLFKGILYIDDFDPATTTVKYQDQIVVDAKSHVAYWYLSDGTYLPSPMNFA